MIPTCHRCHAPEAIVHLTLNRGPREFEWCQRCYEAFRVWAELPPEPPSMPLPPVPRFTTPKPKKATRRKR